MEAGFFTVFGRAVTGGAFEPATFVKAAASFSLSMRSAASRSSSGLKLDFGILPNSLLLASDKEIGAAPGGGL